VLVNNAGYGYLAAVGEGEDKDTNDAKTANGARWKRLKQDVFRRNPRHQNERWSTSRPRAQAVLRVWLREYNEERPGKVLAGLMPAAYARQLTSTASIPGRKIRVPPKPRDNVVCRGI
jgi:hypothetical protein